MCVHVITDVFTCALCACVQCVRTCVYVLLTLLLCICAFVLCPGVVCICRVHTCGVYVCSVYTCHMHVCKCLTFLPRPWLLTVPTTHTPTHTRAPPCSIAQMGLSRVPPGEPLSTRAAPLCSMGSPPGCLDLFTVP
jgi:hypothetical protein